MMLSTVVISKVVTSVQNNFQSIFYREVIHYMATNGI